MTEEQIKQNALKAEKEHGNFNYQYQGEAFNKGYIAGAHSSDKEIEALEERIRILELASKVDDYLLDAINERLRNPWISIEDRLPKDGDIVFTHSVLIIESGGVRNEEEQYLTQKYTCRWITDETKQINMCGEKYDIVNKVTHWMPIPELKKGE